MVKIVRHCQPRGTETDRLNLNYSRHCSTRQKLVEPFSIRGRFRSAQELSNTGGRSVSEHCSVVRPLHMKPIEVDKDEGAKGIKTLRWPMVSGKQ